MPPAHKTTGVVGRQLKPPSGLTPGHAPMLSPCKEPACPRLRKLAGKGTWLVVPTPANGVGAPVKPLLDFLSGLWSISID